MDLLDELETRVVCGDGAMGTLLLNAGVPLDHCLEELCVSDPERIRGIHEQYIGAGARVIETHSFGANAVRLDRFGMATRASEINRAAAQVATNVAKGKNVYVAGSVGPLGITAAEATARGVDRSKCFCEQIAALLDGGVQLIFFETFMDVEEMAIALLAKNELSEAPAICSFACGNDGRLPSGILLAEAFARMRQSGAKLMGLNCMNGPREMQTLLRELPDKHLLAVYPTAGQPTQQGGRLVYDVTPKVFGESVRDLALNGARLIGGCCGTTPAHIAAVAGAIADLAPS
jgi:methionine synthase / methylenetetrahydrofolate reductase(NADPH)